MPTRQAMIGIHILLWFMTTKQELLELFWLRHASFSFYTIGRDQLYGSTKLQ